MVRIMRLLQRLRCPVRGLGVIIQDIIIRRSGSFFIIEFHAGNVEPDESIQLSRS